MREKTNEVRHSLNRTTVKNQSANKYATTALSPTYGSYNACNTTLNDEEKEKMKRKQSLKDILRNKRDKSGYKGEKEGKYENKMEGYFAKETGKSYGVSPVLSKYYKHSPMAGQSSMKDMKAVYSYSRY